ncbi:CCCH-type zinc finger family protein [Klebsormidium nitens]|uniref:CCCH-type zinc finger family protein n=1 Tax=Klebsormidium nitens TaxID=105231 RepID=A0A1Y1IP73_KLENI|nr:CCCH-type zinc finger family protein [Klebsormidium nitens]|eukprot:GAQ91892.1 CCCH-type zinc finger family protein [Klebsormidium nitens]
MAPEVLEDFLLRTLQPLSAADPELLSNYVAALLKNPKPLPELRKLCLDQLWDFLADSTQEFVDALFEAIEDGRVELPAGHVALQPHSEPPSTEETPTPDDAGYPEERWPAAGDAGLYEEQDAEAEGGQAQEGEGTAAVPRPVVVKVPSALARLAGRYDENEDDESDEDEGGRGNRRRGRSERSRSPPEKLQGRGQRVQEEGVGPGGRDGWRGRGGGRSNGRMDGPLHAGGRGRFGGRGDERFRGRGMPDGPRWDGPPGPRFDPGRGPMRPVGDWGSVKPEPGFPGGRFERRPDFPPFLEPPFPRGPGPLGRGMPPPLGPEFGRPPGPHVGPPPFFGGPERWEPFDARVPPPEAEYEMRMRLMRGLERRPEGEGRPQKCPEFFGERGYCLRGRLCPYDHGEDVQVVRDEHALRQLSLARQERNGAGGAGPRQERLEDDLPQHEFDVPQTGGPAEARGEDEGYDPDTPLWEARGAGEGTPGQSRRGPDAGADREAGAPRVRPRGVPESAAAGLPSGLGRFAWSGRAVPGRGPGDRRDPERSGGERQGPSGQRPGLCARGPEGGDEGEGGGRGWGRGPIGDQPQAEKTLFVTGIPEDQNNVSQLLGHFKKFGHVVIRCFGGDKAHVLFDSHEEAAKALAAPDALLGNRFIKLFWAREELDLAKMGGKYGTRPAAETGETANDDAKSAVDEKLVPKANGISKGQTYVRPGSEKGAAPTLTEAQRVAAEKAALALKIKQLEATVLEAKIAEQRRALAELEKKAGKVAAQSDLKRAGSSASEGATPPPGKKAKVGPGMGWAGPVAGGFKSHLKLDNRSTVVHVVGPLPGGVSKEALRMHFWRFGEVVTVQVPDAGSRDAGAGVAAKVVFRQRHDAEAALVEGKEVEGQPLKLVWGPPFKPAQPALSPKPQSSGAASGASAGRAGGATSSKGAEAAGSGGEGHRSVVSEDVEEAQQAEVAEMNEQAAGD